HRLRPAQRVVGEPARLAPAHRQQPQLRRADRAGRGVPLGPRERHPLAVRRPDRLAVAPAVREPPHGHRAVRVRQPQLGGVLVGRQVGLLDGDHDPPAVRAQGGPARDAEGGYFSGLHEWICYWAPPYRPVQWRTYRVDMPRPGESGRAQPRPSEQEWIDRGGDHLGLRWYPATSAAAPMVVLWPAMGVPAGY